MNKENIITEIRHAVNIWFDSEVPAEDRFNEAINHVAYAIGQELEGEGRLIVSKVWDYDEGMLYSTKLAIVWDEEDDDQQVVLLPTLTWDVDEGKSQFRKLVDWFKD